MPPPSLIPPTLPEDFCQLSPQEQANVLIGSTQISPTTSFDNLLIQPATPEANQRNKAWLRLEGANLTPDRIYKWALGSWISQHPVPPATSYRVMWIGNEADLWSFDGGDGSDPSTTPPTATSGAMWEVDTAFAARMPIGPGTLPISSTAVPVGGTGGLERVTLTGEEGAMDGFHQHVMAQTTGPSNNDAVFAKYPSVSFSPSSPEGFEIQGDNSQPGGKPGISSGDLVTSGPVNVNNGNAIKSHQNMPPYVGVYFIKRTGRQFYVAP